MSVRLLHETGAARAIPGFAKYAASADGRIWRILPVRSTRYKNRPLPYEITQTLGKTGYWSASIDDDLGRRLKPKTHRLVAAAFHGPAPSPKSVAAHLDGNRQNNCPENLAWANQKENVFHKRAHGTSARWALKQETVMSTKLLKDCGESLYGPHWQCELARALDVSDRTMRRWVSGSDLPPAGIAADLLRLCMERAGSLRELTTRLKRAVSN